MTMAMDDDIDDDDGLDFSDDPRSFNLFSSST